MIRIHAQDHEPCPLHVNLVVQSRQRAVARVWRGGDDATKQDGNERLDKSQMKTEQPFKTNSMEGKQTVRRGPLLVSRNKRARSHRAMLSDRILQRHRDFRVLSTLLHWALDNSIRIGSEAHLSP